MSHLKMISIYSKKQLTVEQEMKLFDAIIDIVGDKNLLTCAGREITKKKRFWELLNNEL